MTVLLESERSRYVETLNKLGIYTKEVTDFFAVRNLCQEELSGMRTVVSTLQPVPGYMVYGGAVPLFRTKNFLYHSRLRPFITLEEAFMDMHGRNDGFSIDKNGQIVLASPDVLLPRVKVYDPEVIVTDDVYHLPEEHASRILFSLADELIIKIGTYGCNYYTFQRLLLREGFKESTENIF